MENPTASKISRFFLWSLLGFLLILDSCGKKGPPEVTPPPDKPVENQSELHWGFGPRAIKIGIIADSRLNLTNDIPTALSLCFYQLSETGVFALNSTNSKGLSSLAECPPGGNDPAAPVMKGLVSADRYFIQPGERRDLIIDRHPSAQYIGVAGGFSSLPALNGAAFLPIPIKENQKWFFANTFEIMELRAWLIIQNQTLSFFHKAPENYNSLAKDFPLTDPQGSGSLTSPCPPDREPPPNNNSGRKTRSSNNPPAFPTPPTVDPNAVPSGPKVCSP
ncbi:MAG: type VI secretion lipoprotein TssJ [Deltaproteobacteria bacterium]|nr:type VI secretion lipoprotein TssJ [Deltaproteobacteria bacterium]